ncbi:MAG: tetratricopeptide repeat protein [Saprospiraceae bacterium]
MKEAKNLLGIVQTFNKNKEWQKTIEILPEKELERLRNGDLYAEKAESYYRLKQYEDSKAAAEKALAIDLSHAKGSYYLGNWFVDKLNYDKAVELYQKAILLYPEYAPPYNGLGNVYRDKKEYDKAAELYQKAILLDPEYAYPHNGLGNVYVDKKEYDKAAEYYQNAIKLDPEYPPPNYNLGGIYADKKEYDKAAEFYQKAIELDPKDADYHYGLGYVYHDKKEYDKAVEHYKKTIELDPTFDSPHYGLGITYSVKKEYNEAIIAFETYTKITPDKTDYFFNQAKEQISELKKLIRYGDSYENISKAIYEIKSLLHVKDGCITHYTSLSAARSLILDSSKFRLSEGAFLNDTSEGRELFQYLDFHVSRPNNHDTIAELFSRKPFIGSFVNEHKHDDLTLWRMYGKENKEEARGCAITLNIEQFVEQIKNELNGGRGKSIGNREGVAMMDKEFVFYLVAYRNEKNEFILPGTDLDKNTSLNNLMRKLAKSIKDFNKHKKKNPLEQRDAAELLNEIAYLFKTAEYQYENEIRLVIEKTGFDVKLTHSDEVPKAYIEIGEIKNAITKITLGPKVERAAEWAALFYYSLQKDDLKPDIYISRLPFK